jgi:hypothetical protein
LLHLEQAQGQSPEQFQITTVSFSGLRPNSAAHEALSYAWGDLEVTTTIYVNGQSLRVTISLEAFLRRRQASWRLSELTPFTSIRRMSKSGVDTYRCPQFTHSAQDLSFSSAKGPRIAIAPLRPCKIATFKILQDGCCPFVSESTMRYAMSFKGHGGVACGLFRTFIPVPDTERTKQRRLDPNGA